MVVRSLGWLLEWLLERLSERFILGVLAMQFVYELKHKNFKEIDEETGEKIFDSKLLGFLSSQQKCEQAISFYLKLPGFKEVPEGFTIDEVEADIDEFNDIPGSFKRYVYYLAHEWYDGCYDYVSSLGYYSTRKKAEEGKIKYRCQPELMAHQDGFCIVAYEIDRLEWREGFVSWEEAEKYWEETKD